MNSGKDGSMHNPICISVRNYRGAIKAEVDLDGITLIAGPNGAGKSSIIEAAAAVLTGQTIPVEGVLKKDAAALVTSRAKDGAVCVESDAGSASITWPDAKMITKGEPPTASPIAAGLERFETMTASERVRYLTDLLKAEPTEQDLGEAIARDGLSEAVKDKLWQIIFERGWDGAHDHVKTRGAEMKGEWRHVTGESYGSTKASGWRPKGWEHDLAGQSIKTLEAAVDDARVGYQALSGRQSVDVHRLAEARKAAGEIPEVKAVIKSMELRVTELKEVRGKARARLDAVPSTPDEANGTCPECDASLVISRRSGGYELKKPVTIGPAEADSIKVEGLAAHEAHVKADSDLMRAENDLRAEQARLTFVTKQASDLATLEKAANDAPDAKILAEAQLCIDATQARLDAFKTKREADSIADRIANNTRIGGILMPGGLRRQALIAALAGLNDRLANIADKAGWQPPSVTDDLAVIYGGRPIGLASSSERFRAYVTIQLALAGLDGSQAVLIDAADILDQTGRNSLMRALLHVGIQALIAMTIDRPGDVPDLSAKGVGRSYWISDGTTELLGVIKVAA